MEQITEQVVKNAKIALGENDYVQFFKSVGFKVYGDVKIGNVEEPNGIELEAFTDAGEDMIVCIEVKDDWKESFREYAKGFDITENILLWWQNGENFAKKRGLPFNNMKEHIEDYEGWMAWINDIVSILDGEDPTKQKSETSNEKDAIRRWVYWCSNYSEPQKWVKEIWGTGCMAKHFLAKFNESKSMNDFFRNLDSENQERLSEYVLKHYYG